MEKMKRKFIVKSNNLIEAKYRLSLQESRIILWLLSQIERDDEEFKRYRLTIQEFAKMLDISTDNPYSEIDKVVKRLMTRVMLIYSKELSKDLRVSWLSSADYLYNEGCVLLEFSPQLKPYLLQLKKQFTKIDLADTLKLKSMYAIRIFELLQQYEPIGKREISVEDLKAYCGIAENEYALYGHLKTKVINRAKTEINAKTGYEVNYTEKKESRKITSLDWSVKKKTHFEKHQDDKLNDLLSESKKGLLEKLIELGFGRSKAYQFFSSHTEDQIANALAVVLYQVKKGKVLNPKALFNSALKEGWSTKRYTVKKQ